MYLCVVHVQYVVLNRRSVFIVVSSRVDTVIHYKTMWMFFMVFRLLAVVSCLILSDIFIIYPITASRSRMLMVYAQDSMDSGINKRGEFTLIVRSPSSLSRLLMSQQSFGLILRCKTTRQYQDDFRLEPMS